MIDSNRITELNNRSIELTDAELLLVDKFSVSLPMNELPEIVVVGTTSKPIRRSEDNRPTTIPFQTVTENKQTLEGPANETNAKPEILDARRSEPENTQPESGYGSVDQTEIKLPRDELDLSSGEADTVEFKYHSEHRPSSSIVDSQEDAVFRIENYNSFQDRFEQVAQNIEESIQDAVPRVIVLTSPTGHVDQNCVLNSILTKLANGNEALRMISVQAIELDDEAGQFSVGLGHVLSEENQLVDVVIPTSIENLDYLGYSNCRSILATTFRNRIEKVFVDLKKHYDLIFVNSKNTSSFETKAIAELADATYLLISIQDVEQEAAIEATQELRECGAQLAGCILTDGE